MNALIKNNKIVEIYKTPKTITVDDVTYPKGIFKDSEALISFGILPFREITPDQRYYSFSEFTDEVSASEAIRTHTAIPRDVADLKKNMIDTIKSQVGARLKPTDWMVIREMDGGDAMAQEVKDYRAAIRAEGNTKEVEVDVLTTLDDVILYEATPHTEVRKVKHTDEDGVETYGDETKEYTREINMTMHFDAVDPLAEVDPAFVSLTKD